MDEADPIFVATAMVQLGTGSNLGVRSKTQGLSKNNGMGRPFSSTKWGMGLLRHVAV